MRARFARIPIAAAFALALAGCSIDFMDGAGPKVEPPNVAGRLLRNGTPVVDVKVKLRDLSGLEIDSDRTDAQGRYQFRGVQAGTWELRVRTGLPDDFSTLTTTIVVVEGALLEIPAIDVFGYGSHPLQPVSGDSLALPTFFQPLEFVWSGPQRPFDWMNARLYDRNDTPIWFSDKGPDTTALFNGLGNQGEHNAQPIAPGEYWWRVKISLADSVVATMESGSVLLGEP